MINNGGFPPIKYINNTKNENKEIKKERFFSPNIKALDIKQILSSSVNKPMMDINKNKVDIIDSL